jgi:hypothetical protein
MISNHSSGRACLEQRGLTLADVESIDVPNAARLEAFTTGQIDLTITTEPTTSQIVRSGQALRWRAVAEVLPNRQSSYLVFGRRLIDERATWACASCAPTRERCARTSSRGRTELIEIVAAKTHLDPVELRTMCGRPSPRTARWIA